MKNKFLRLGTFLAFACSASALAASRFEITPNPGVTVDQLSQARVNQIAGDVSAAQAEGVAQADQNYANGIKALHLDPGVDVSGEILNTQVAELTAQREEGYHHAIEHAIAVGNEECAGFCTVSFQ